jgi:hypothetical protein
VLGATANDLNQRIEMISKKIREVFFGPIDQTTFTCKKENGQERTICLPEVEGSPVFIPTFFLCLMLCLISYSTGNQI